MKKCSKCGRILPSDQFNKNKNSKDGLQHRCRQCFSEYNKARYANNPEKFKADVKRYKEENPESCLKTRIKTCMKNPTHMNASRVVEAALKLYGYALHAIVRWTHKGESERAKHHMESATNERRGNDGQRSTEHRR